MTLARATNHPCCCILHSVDVSKPNNMVASKIYIDQWGAEWIIHKAFLEIKPSHTNVLLLVVDVSGQKHRVVFGDRFVNGNWRIVSPLPGKPPASYDVTFHWSGYQEHENWCRYDRIIGTDVFLRRDGGIFAEITDFEATIEEYSPKLTWRTGLSSEVHQ